MKPAKTLLLGALILQFATAPGAQAATVSINPETIRQWVISSNLGIVEELQQVHLAKERVGVDYANLLPSLNLGFLVQGKTSAILSSITFLLPFLLPSNWINVRTDRELFESEKLSYRILQLNSYSSALETYYTVLSNQALLAIDEQQEKNLDAIAGVIAQSVKIGTTTKRDLLVAQGQTLAAHEQVLKTREMIDGETIALRQAMGFPITTTLNFEPSTVAETEAEGDTLEVAIDRANQIAPELKQLGLMQLAAGHAKWSEVFAFIQNPTFGTQSTPDSDGKFKDASLSKLLPKGSFNFGFAAFPSYRVGETNGMLLQVRRAEAEMANQTAVSTAYAGVAEAKERLDTAFQAERNFQEVYDVDLERYTLGTLGLTDLLIDQNSLNSASIMRTEATLDLNLQRTILNRALIADSFTKISGCASDEVAKSQTGVGRFLRSVFGQKKGLITLDQLCHVPPPDEAPAEPLAKPSA